MKFLYRPAYQQAFLGSNLAPGSSRSSYRPFKRCYLNAPRAFHSKRFNLEMNKILSNKSLIDLEFFYNHWQTVHFWIARHATLYRPPPCCSYSRPRQLLLSAVLLALRWPLRTPQWRGQQLRRPRQNTAVLLKYWHKLSKLEIGFVLPVMCNMMDGLVPVSFLLLMRLLPGVSP